MSLPTFLRVSVSPYRTALLFMIGSAAAWGTGTVMSKYSLNYVPPFTLLVVQLVASVALLWIFVFIRRVPPPINLTSLRLGATGILEPGLAFVLALIGLARTSASVASFIGATESFMVIVVAYFLLRERVSRRILFLMLITLVGVILISGADSSDSSSHSLVGDLLVLAGTASAAFYVVLSSRSVSQMEPLPLAALQQSFGLVFALLVLPIGLAGGEWERLSSIPVSVWLWVILNGIVQYMLAFLFYLTALKGMPATRAALYLTLIPVFAVVESFIFLGEQMTLIQLIGGGLILGSLVALRQTPHTQIEGA